MIKNEGDIVPIAASSQRRVLFVTTNIVSPLHGEPINFVLPDLMRAKGFDVTIHDPA